MRLRWTGFHSPLAQGIEQFLSHKRGLGARYHTEESALRLLDRFLVECAVTSTTEITPELLDCFLSSRPRRSARSYNHLLGVIKHLLSWLSRQGYPVNCPVRTRPRRSTAQRIPFLFGPAEARRLLEHAARLKDNSRAPLRGVTYRTVFALLYGLGLRVGEVSRLCVEDLDTDRRLLVIRQTKFAKDRLVPFGPRIETLLSEYLRLRTGRYGEPQSGAPLFSFGGTRPIHPCTIGQTFHALVPQLGLHIPEGVSPPRLHDLRHSFAVGTLLRWYREGIDPGARLIHLATFLGHVDPASTAVYLTMTTELLQEANRRFESLAAPALQETST